MAGQKVREVMTQNVQCLGPHESVQQAARLMRELDVGSIPVCGEDLRPVGIVTDRDLALRCLADGGDPGAMQIADVMERSLVTVGPEQDADEAVAQMAENQLRRLPVVDRNGVLVGIVAQADLARLLPEQVVGNVVEAISESG
jgi:CBS domain-containing protein